MVCKKQQRNEWLIYYTIAHFYNADFSIINIIVLVFYSYTTFACILHTEITNNTY